MSIISIIGIIIGITTIIITLSAINGFIYELHNRFFTIIPHGEIEPANRPFINWQKIIHDIKLIPGIKSAWPYINLTGLLDYQNNLRIIYIKAINPSQDIMFNTISKFISEETCNNFKNKNKQIILGQNIIKNLKINPGDLLKIIYTKNNNKQNLTKSKYIMLQFSGILASNSYLDNNIALIHLEDAQIALNKTNEIDGIAIKVNNIFKADKLIKIAAIKTNVDVYIQNWKQLYGYIYQDIQKIRKIIYLFMILISCVAACNISAILIMTLKEKKEEIAILFTIGIQNNNIKNIFIWYGLIKTITGCTIGTIIGVIISLNLSNLYQLLENIMGRKILSEDVYFINFLPTKIHILDIVTVWICVIIFIIFSCLYSYKKIKKIKPAHILK